MHAALTRAAGQHRGRRRTTAALLVLTAALGCLAGPLGAAQAPVDDLNPITGSLQPVAADHELTIDYAQPGAESLALGARLMAGGGLITRPIAWTVRYSLGTGRGDIVWQGAEALPETPLAPGDYVVEARYGTAHVEQAVSIATGQRLAMTIVLDVGGIRPLSRIDGVGYPSNLPATHAIYALTGPDAGKRIAAGLEQGEIVRVAAGSYRVESRFGDGNTVAETRVTVKPGVLSSIEISHLAAYALVAIPAPQGSVADWRISKLDGDWSRSGKGDAFALVLAPGSYEITADVAGSVRKTQFSVKPRDIKHLTLGE